MPTLSVAVRGAPAAEAVPSAACAGCRGGEALDFAITMAFQPIVELASGRVYGHEALVRGADGAGAAAVLARVTETTRYAFDQRCRRLALEQAHAAGLLADPGARVSINFLPGAVYRPEVCIRATLAVARRLGVALSRVVFEVSESEGMTRPEHLAHIFAEYRRFGFLTALDDFGTGHSNLDRLADLAPDIVKIDRHLVRGLDADARRFSMVRAVARLASELGVTVVAEGVETEGERAAVRDAGIPLAQGYLLGRPALMPSRGA